MVERLRMAPIKPLAVLDSNILIFAILDDEAADPDALRQKQAVIEKLEAMSSTHRFGIPAVVLAELPDDTLRGPQLKTFVATVTSVFRILALGRTGGEEAAKLCAERIRKRPIVPSRDREKKQHVIQFPKSSI